MTLPRAVPSTTRRGPSAPTTPAAARRKTPATGHPRSRAGRPAPTIAPDTNSGRRTGSTPDRSAYRRAVYAKDFHRRARESRGNYPFTARAPPASRGPGCRWSSRGQAPGVHGGVHPGDAADGRTPASPGWQQEPPRERSSRPAGQEWSAAPSSAPNWAVAPAAAPPSTGWSYVDSIRTSELVPTKKMPPRKGWRRFVYRGTFGLVNLGPSPDEQRLADLENKIRSLLRGHYKIGVFGKGGVGKTTVAASVGSIFAELRQDDRVVAIDADTAFGKLGSRIDPNAAGSYWELAADEHLDTFADVRSRVGNNSAGLFVLAGESSTARRRVLDPAIYREATARLDRHFTISIVDCGSTMDSAIAQEVLRDLDALIVVSSPWVDGASAAGQTMEWLANRGYTGLLHRTVVVLNDSDGHADKRTRSILVQQFASRGQVVVEVPFDSHLRPGGVIDVTSEMSPMTRRRFIEITAAIAEHFASTTDGPRDRR